MFCHSQENNISHIQKKGDNTMKKNYTYTMFAQDVIAMLNGEKVDTEKDTMLAKAEDLLQAQLNKAAYNAAHPRKSTAKGPSEKTAAVIAAIKPVLGAEPMTAADINAALGTTYTALMVANAVKYIDGVTACKVVRTTTNSKGLKADKEYTAYKLG